MGELLKAAGITPIFAVTGDGVAETYQELVDSWGFGVVTDLGPDSTQLFSAITDGLHEAVTDVSLTISGDDFGYVSALTPSVYESAGPGTYTFDITLEIPEDSTSYSSDDLTLEIAGYGTINLEIEIASVDVTGDGGDDSLSGDDGPNALVGLDGNDTLVGNGGDDVLDGGAGDDVLTGGLGDDTFVFADGDGDDVLTDFEAGADSGDVIDLRKVTAIASFADVISGATEVSGDTVIALSADDSITLQGVTIAELEAADFMV